MARADRFQWGAAAAFRDPPAWLQSEEFLGTFRPPFIRRPIDMAPDRVAPVVGTWREPSLLESGPGFGDAGRYSILAARPRLTFAATGTSWTLTSDTGETHTGRGDPLAELDVLLRRFGLSDFAPRDDEAPPFAGGLIGFFGYDLAPRIERLGRKAMPDSRIPDVRFSLYDTAVIVDRRAGSVDLWAFDLLGEGNALLQQRARDWLADLRQVPRPRPNSTLGPITSTFTAREYEQAVGRALEYIAAGDIFQVNLSQRFQTIGTPNPLDLYLRLRERSPAPFSAYLAWDDLAVVSASPESFYEVNAGRIVTRPIKGTRPRGKTPEADARLAAELAASAKDRAELTMIVDLERNDLGRVSQYGSVKVLDPMAVESFAQVHHLVATVEGRLRDGVGPIDVVRAVFPGGSITGAPKIRAMQIIDELEPNRRSLYTGAIGYYSRGGRSAFNIAIRTILVEGGRASFQVGGGIVADSDPSGEYHETLDKGRALREIMSGE